MSDLNSLSLNGVDTEFEVQSFEIVTFKSLLQLDLTPSTDTTKFHLEYFTSEIIDTSEFNQLKP